MPAIPHWSIRTRVRVTACVLIAATAWSVGAWHIDRRSRAIADAAGEAQLMGARRLADALASDLASRMQAVSSAARSEVLRDSNDPYMLRKPLETLRDSLPVYGWVGLLDNAGTVVAATSDVLAGQSLAARPLFQQGRQGAWSGDPHEAGPLTATMPHVRGQTPMLIDMAAPVLAADGSPRGVLAVQMSWQWARRLRTTAMRTAPAAVRQQYAILDASGQALLAAERADTLESRLPPREGAEGSGAVLSATAQVPAVVGVRFAGWRVQATADAAYVATDIRHLVHDTIVFAVLGVIAACGFAWWLVGAVAAPLGRMSCSMRSPLRQCASGRRRSDMQLIGDRIVALQRSIEGGPSLNPNDDATAADAQMLRDPLTGLWTRTYLQRFTNELLLVAALRPMEVCVLCIDLDDFRSFNERHGRDAGDRMLQQVASRLDNLSREGDIAFRLAGDDFLLLLPCPVGEGQGLATRMAARVVQELSQPVVTDTAGWQVDCSVGIAVWRGESTLADVMGAADVALHSEPLGAGRRAQVGMARNVLAA